MTEAAHQMCSNPLPENGPHKVSCESDNFTLEIHPFMSYLLLVCHLTVMFLFKAGTVGCGTNVKVGILDDNNVLVSILTMFTQVSHHSWHKLFRPVFLIPFFFPASCWWNWRGLYSRRECNQGLQEQSWSQYFCLCWGVVSYWRPGTHNNTYRNTYYFSPAR